MSHKRAIVVDDDPLVRSVITRSFEQAGIECFATSHGIDAERQILENGRLFHLIVVDLVLPHGHTGWDIIRLMRNNPDTAGIPIIVLTGVALSRTESEKLRQRVDVVVQKHSFEVADFQATVNGLLAEGAA